ncbi:MAG: class I SAM-dependent methyltransferase [Dehalococcoidia bacterium]
MVESTVGEYFGSLVEKYDSLIRRGLPRYQEMLDELVESLPEGADDILELGCGTGALTLRIADRCPDARITVVDAAPEMVDLTQARLSEAHPRVAERATFLTSTFESLEIEEEAYDCITASMSLHHVIDKAPFYERLHGALRDGGSLVVADELTGAVPYVQALHWDRWERFARLPDHLTVSEIDSILAHMGRFDHYETLPRQLDLLAGAGFRAVDCAWRHINYGIFVAVR